MKNIFAIIFLCIIIMSKEDTISNPQSATGKLPEVLSFDNYYYLILDGGYVYKIDKLTKEYEPHSYPKYPLVYKEPYLWIIDEDNNLYLIYSKKLHMFNIMEEIPLKYLFTIPEKALYVRISGYIKETKFENENQFQYCQCDVGENEIIIYGITHGNTGSNAISFFLRTKKQL